MQLRALTEVNTRAAQPRESRQQEGWRRTENQALLRRRNALLFLDALLDARDGIVGLDVDLDLLSGQRLHLDLSAAETTGSARSKQL